MAVLEDLRTKTGELLDEGLRSGALTPEEHSWRRGHLTRAETLDALESLVEDLLSPSSGSVADQSLVASRASQMTLMASRSFQVADLGRRSELVTIMGSTRIDLRNLAVDESLTLELVTIMGDATVEVPPGVKVKVDCTPVMGDCIVAPQVQGPNATVRITGVVLMGSLRVIPSKR